ncbi:hypothetical protein, partial [Salmonella enterica]|uniref:hypothetical protein n=1 Tax=Salmonella enterica TaxID=28901 RepID=UPI001CB7B6B5
YHFSNGGKPTRRAAVFASMQGGIPGGGGAGGKKTGARIFGALGNPRGVFPHNGVGRRLPGIWFFWGGGG